MSAATIIAAERRAKIGIGAKSLYRLGSPLDLRV
jgi:hypothetical protein